jgi:chemotaxis signal transduction protein
MSETALLQPDAAQPEAGVLLFGLSTELYALRIEEAVEAMSLPAFTVVPRMPGYLLGVCFRRGRLLPIVDLGRRLGLRQSFRSSLLQAARTTRPAVLVARTRLGELGLLVDRILRVAKVPAAALEPAAAAPPFTLGAVTAANVQAHLLDLEAVGRLEPDGGGP